jgi:hypothetical protein
MCAWYRLAFFLSLTLTSRAMYAQDELYLQKDIKKKGKITEISPLAVKYQDPQNSSQYLLVPNDKILFVINSKGDFLVPSQLTESPYSKSRVNHFINADTNYSRADQLFFSPDQRVEGSVTNEDKNFIYLVDTPGKLDKKDLVAVIYHNGVHKFYGPTDKVAAVLGHFQHPPDSLAVPSAAGSTPTTAPSAASTAVSTSASTAALSGSDSTLQSSPQPSLPSPQSAAGPDPGADTAGARRNREFASIAPNVSRKEFEDKATKKTEQLTQYLNILCNKRAENEEVTKAMDQAITLFINDSALVEVASVNTNAVKQYTIRKYLGRLKVLKYDRIAVQWTNVQYLSDLRKGTDGNFYGLVQFEQRFSGYNDNKLVYQDITVKKAEVELKVYEKSYEGSSKLSWDVLLGNIGVKSFQSF